MNFARELTNPGQSLVYVGILLVSIHLLFNSKMLIFLTKTRIVPKSFFVESNISRIVPMRRQNGHLDPITIPTPNYVPYSTPQSGDVFEDV